MPIPEFVRELRTVIGPRPLWMSGVTAVVLDDQGRLLLGRRADTGRWALITGIIDPGEQPADTAVRECWEETGVHVVPERLTSVTVSAPLVHANGDQAQYLELTFLCRAVGGEAKVNDDESLEVGWFDRDALPADLDASALHRVHHALSGSPEAHFMFDESALDQSFLTR
ncbi:8-oxo-dGTP pyrophosphatase MutT (NUDIX family) [Streptacidiphilus sp. MAP12-16]|uniref:NUDIX hydrolase n=1 Tax=Streptacidiphilus sp. MAP12-16 TaxID=3156300 RepID=UPI003515E772